MSFIITIQAPNNHGKRVVIVKYKKKEVIRTSVSVDSPIWRAIGQEEPLLPIRIRFGLQNHFGLCIVDLLSVVDTVRGLFGDSDYSLTELALENWRMLSISDRVTRGANVAVTSLPSTLKGFLVDSYIQPELIFEACREAKVHKHATPTYDPNNGWVLKVAHINDGYDDAYLISITFKGDRVIEINADILVCHGLLISLDFPPDFINEIGATKSFFFETPLPEQRMIPLLGLIDLYRSTNNIPSRLLFFAQPYTASIFWERGLNVMLHNISDESEIYRQEIEYHDFQEYSNVSADGYIHLEIDNRVMFSFDGGKGSLHDEPF